MRWFVNCWSRLRRECVDAAELVLLPGLAAVLPWGLCFRLFTRIARWQWLYAQAAQADWHQAHAKGLGSDQRRWLWERKLVQLVDHADFYLHKTRSDAWLHKHVHVQGAWAAEGTPTFLFTFHWGAGMWGLRHARQAGLRVHALSAPAPDARFVGRWVLGRYVRARLKAVEEALGLPLVLVPKGLRQVKEALTSGEQVLTLLDVPQDANGNGRSYDLLKEKIALSMAIPEMAARQQAPCAMYVTGLNLCSGQRFLDIRALPAHMQLEEMEAALLGWLENCICQSPAAWHLWGQWPRFCSEQGRG